MDLTRKDFIVKEERWARYKYNLSTPMGKSGKRLTGSKEHIKLSREAASEGMVLLENDGILPLKKGTKVALFGIGTLDYIKGGGGSGRVYCEYTKNIYDGFKENGNSKIFEELTKWYYEYGMEVLKSDPLIKIIEEPIVPDNLIKKAADFTDTAIITIHRYSRESVDRFSTKGDFYLTDVENFMVEKITKSFKNVVAVLNVGGMVDVDWIKSNKNIRAALLSWQAGMEGGSAVADIICGQVNPSGKLTDTFAKKFLDYPSADKFNEDPYSLSYYEDIYVGYRYFLTIPGAKSKINYPFGYGLSYTEFKFSKPQVKQNKDKITFEVTVKNIGKFAGKEVIQCYYSAPQGKLGKPNFELGAFAKTKLLKPNESQTLKMQFDINDMASFDDLGKCQKSAFVLEKGSYKFYAGNSSVNLKKADFEYKVKEEFIVTKQCSELCAPNRLPYRMLSDGSFEKLPSVPVKDYNPDYKVPDVKMPTKDTQFKLIDVVGGKLTLDEFMTQLTDEDLIYILGGHENHGLAVTSGFTGNEYYGIPQILTTDGPAGVRLFPQSGIPTTAWPCATLIASSFNTDLMYKIGVAGGKEAKENGLAVWLTPALNIHRNPLCGRNFEYFSEDPLVAGKFAAAKVKGIQSVHTAASVKHFACNNREENRKSSDSRVSQRALREIYLKGFEICIKEADPWTLMTSYNAINNVLACENYELITGILRNEWGYKGMVTSDWTPLSYQPRLVKAGNDVRMPRGQVEQLEKAVKSGELTRGQMLVCAKRVLELVLKLD